MLQLLRNDGSAAAMFCFGAAGTDPRQAAAPPKTSLPPLATCPPFLQCASILDISHKHHQHLSIPLTTPEAHLLPNPTNLTICSLVQSLFPARWRRRRKSSRALTACCLSCPPASRPPSSAWCLAVWWVAFARSRRVSQNGTSR